MKENLNREFTIKTKTWKIIVGSFLTAFVVSLLIYLIFTDYNKILIELLQEFNTHKEALKVAELMFPIAFVVIMTCKLGELVISRAEEKPKKKSKKK